MRPDMPKRFLKHGKHTKGRFPRHCKNLSMKDENGQFVHNPKGMKKIHRYTIKYEDCGYLGTDFALLCRFLQSRTGRPWDQVYSEICAEADDRSFEGHHFREWLDMQVEQNCTIDEDGEVQDERGNHMARFHGEFYVHPVTGLLEYIENKRWRRSAPVQRVFSMDGKLYHEHKGIWYRVEMKELVNKDGRTYWSSDIYDVFLSEGLEFAVYWHNVARLL